MALLNLHIKQEVEIGKEENLFRGINCTALKHAEPGERYRFIQYASSSVDFEQAKKFLHKNKRK
jgi:accessory colonization factor AcfC